MSKGVQASFSLADLHVSFPQGFEMGALHLFLIDKANRYSGKQQHADPSAKLVDLRKSAIRKSKLEKAV